VPDKKSALELDFLFVAAIIPLTLYRFDFKLIQLVLILCPKSEIPASLKMRNLTVILFALDFVIRLITIFSYGDRSRIISLVK